MAMIFKTVVALFTVNNVKPLNEYTSIVGTFYVKTVEGLAVLADFVLGNRVEIHSLFVYTVGS